MTGIPLTGNPPPKETSTRDALVSGLVRASGGIFGGGSHGHPVHGFARPDAGRIDLAAPADAADAPDPTSPPKIETPQEKMLRDLTRAAEGAGQIADGAGPGPHEIAQILADPVGRQRSTAS